MGKDAEAEAALLLVLLLVADVELLEAVDCCLSCKAWGLAEAMTAKEARIVSADVGILILVTRATST